MLFKAMCKCINVHNGTRKSLLDILRKVYLYNVKICMFNVFAPLCLEPSRCNMCHNIFAFLYWNVFRFYCLSQVHEWYSQLHYSVWYLLILCLLFYCADFCLKVQSHLLLFGERFSDSHANEVSCLVWKWLELMSLLLTVHNRLAKSHYCDQEFCARVKDSLHRVQVHCSDQPRTAGFESDFYVKIFTNVTAPF